MFHTLALLASLNLATTAPAPSDDTIESLLAENRAAVHTQAADGYAALAQWAFDNDLYRESAYLVREVLEVRPDHPIASVIKDIESINPTRYVDSYKEASRKHGREFRKRRAAIAEPAADALVALAVEADKAGLAELSEELYVDAIGHDGEHSKATKALKKLDYDIVFNYGVLPAEDKASARRTLKRLRGGFQTRRDLADELEFWSDAWGLETRNFRFVTNAPHSTVFAFAQACEDLYAAWEELMNSGKVGLRRLKDPAVIYFFDSPATYQAILRSTETDVPSADEVLGYFMPATKIGYFYDEPGFYDGDLTLLFETFYHEGMHQLVDLRVKSAFRGGEAKYPLGWVSEGIALYMELLEIDIDGEDRSYRLGEFVDDDLGSGVALYENGDLMDQRDFVHIGYGEFSEYGAGYPHAALLTHFLMEADGRAYRKKMLALIEEEREKGGLKEPLWKYLGMGEDEFMQKLDTHVKDTIAGLPRRAYKKER